MTRQRRALIHLAFLFTAFALFQSNAQGSKEPSPMETLKFGEVADRNVWPTGLSLSFEGKAGMVITLEVTSKTTTGGFDPFVRLLDPEEREEVSDDDSGDQGNCLIKGHALKRDGLYHVFIGGEDNQEGEVEVLLTRAEARAEKRDPGGQNLPAMAAVPLPPPSLPERLASDRAVTRAVWKEDVLFIFEGKAGEAITVSVTSKTPGLDPHVALLDSENNKEASDDDSGGQGNSLIKDHTLRKSGRYIVSVGTAEGRKGQVEVLLKKADKER